MDSQYFDETAFKHECNLQFREDIQELSFLNSTNHHARTYKNSIKKKVVFIMQNNET